MEHGNPGFNSRFRVNAPEASLLPEFLGRPEVRGNGMMQILIDEDLSRLSGAELHLALWGGHPGTTDKRVSVNGRSTYEVRETGTAAGHCTHSYPTIPLKITDLVNGYNALQFACSQGSSFWGHFIVDDTALRLELDDEHPDLRAYGLAEFEALVTSDTVGSEVLRLALSASDERMIDRVIYVGWYPGYDENGSGESLDWHGFSINREPRAVLGVAQTPPFEVMWDTSMVPVCDSMMVHGIVRFRTYPEIDYVTPRLMGLSTGRRPSTVTVELVSAEAIPVPFWSRAGEEKRCELVLDVAPQDVQRAELHMVVWDGGAGSVSEPVKLNEHPLPVVGEGRHDVLYRRLTIDPSLLREGKNEVAVLSDTEHHGIEVLLPGPALMVRWSGH
jgi:hypothetical protein